MAARVFVSVGIIALLIVIRLSLAADPAADRQERHEIVWPDPLTVEALTQGAEEIVARVLEAYPQDPDAHALMGRLHYLHGNTKEAERSWERCLELDPERADIYDAIAKASWESGEFEKTAAACRQALRIDPTMPGVQVRLGRSMLELGEIEAAIAALEQAVSRTGRGHYYLAQAYMQSKAYEKARTSYRRALDIHPDNAQAYYGLALASIRLGEAEKAKQYQEAFRKYGVQDPESVKAQKRDPKQLGGLARERITTAGACTGAADIYRRHGNLQQAEQAYLNVTRLFPDRPEGYEALAQLYLTAEWKLPAAKASASRAARLRPSPQNYFRLAQVCTKIGDRADALTALEQALKMDPGNVPCRRLYDELRKAG